MDFSEAMRRGLPDAAGQLVRGWSFPGSGNTEKSLKLGGQRAVQRVLHEIINVLFPGCHGEEPIPADATERYVGNALGTALQELAGQIEVALDYEFNRRGDQTDAAREAERLVLGFLAELPAIQRVLQTDIVAAYEGDPAAKSTMEVVLSYPGLYAIAVHRVAHFLHRQRVPLLPRIMSESAHSQTGIDIHPGATIGPAFFIDHGTGVVIGETCEIGERVKLYQGVTLGALSFQKDDQGQLVKGIKRHPDVEEGVIIYAGATILGGDTTIGAHSVIGGNVWLTHSVPPHSKVYNDQPSPRIQHAEGSHPLRKQNPIPTHD